MRAQVKGSSKFGPSIDLPAFLGRFLGHPLAAASSRPLYLCGLIEAAFPSANPSSKSSMNLPLPCRPLFTAAALAMLLVMPSGVNAVTALKIDLTAGGNLSTVDRTYTYNLGPTGMRGWIDNGWPETPAQDGYTAFAPYQILVTAVGPRL